MKRTLLILAAVIPLLTATPSFAEEAAERCMSRFIARYAKLTEYSTRVRKVDTLTSDTPNEEIIELKHKKPNETTFKFLNEGNTGIRNNGMTVQYTGGDKLKVALGEARGLGFFINGPAQKMVSGGVSLTDSKVLENEVFTINRAGFGYLADSIQRRLARMNESFNQALTLRGDDCSISYRKHTDEVHTVTLKPKDSVFKLEERFATLAYQIFRNNPSQFSSFEDLFSRDGDVEIRVPEYFLDFDLDLDPETNLPSRLAIYIDGRIAQELFFEDVKFQ